MEKLNLRKEFKEAYTAKKEPGEVFIKKGKFLMLSGKSLPMEEEFQGAFAALYPVAYGVKFLLKEKGKDFAVPPPEALWKMSGKSMKWTLIMRMPSFVTKQHVEKIKKSAFEKKGLAQINKIELGTLAEGRSVQILHEGPYKDEYKTMKILNAYMEEHGLVSNGLHHEVYLSDPGKTVQSKLKTVLRIPVKKK